MSETVKSKKNWKIPGRKWMSVSLPEEVMKRLRIKCVMTGKMTGEVVEDMILKYTDELPDGQS